MVIYKKKVKSLVKKFKTRNPFEIAENLNITVKFVNLSADCPKGFFKKILKRKFIVLNMSRIKNDIELNMIMAHELGHAVLHSSNETFFLHEHTFYNRGKFEYEANMFAAELLIDLEDIDKLYLQGYSIKQLASYYNVPVELIEFRFKENRR